MNGIRECVDFMIDNKNVKIISDNYLLENSKDKVDSGKCIAWFDGEVFRFKFNKNSLIGKVGSFHIFGDRNWKLF